MDIILGFGMVFFPVFIFAGAVYHRGMCQTTFSSDQTDHFPIRGK